MLTPNGKLILTWLVEHSLLKPTFVGLVQELGSWAETAQVHEALTALERLNYVKCSEYRYAITQEGVAALHEP